AKCPKCGSRKTRYRGVARSMTGEYRRFQCLECGGWGQHTKRERGTDVKMQSKERTIERFFEEVKDSVEGQAKRKGYTDNDLGGPNKLSEITKIIGIQRAHAVGECVYKLVEYLKNPRQVLLVKVSGWCYMLWHDHTDEQERVI